MTSIYTCTYNVGTCPTNQMTNKAFRVFPTALDTAPLIGQDLSPEIADNFSSESSQQKILSLKYRIMCATTLQCPLSTIIGIL